MLGQDWHLSLWAVSVSPLSEGVVLHSCITKLYYIVTMTSGIRTPACGFNHAKEDIPGHTILLAVTDREQVTWPLPARTGSECFPFKVAVLLFPAHRKNDIPLYEVDKSGVSMTTWRQDSCNHWHGLPL